MKEIREVRIFEVNNKFHECFVIYEPFAQRTYKNVPKRVKEWINGKYSRSIYEERGNDFISTDVFRA